MYQYKCVVDHVVDGDTLDVVIDLGFDIHIKERVRLAGVNTPEVYGTKAIPQGTTASEFTKRWVTDNNKVRGYYLLSSERYNARDKYGRCLATLSFVTDLGTKSLNEALINQGWGVTK